MADDAKRALATGLSDAVGFVGGALAGWQLGRWLGFDFVGTATYDWKAFVGLAFILAGLGLGKAAAQRWRRSRGLEN